MKKQKKQKGWFTILTISLIGSVACNIGLCTAFFYRFIKEKKTEKIFRLQPFSLEKSRKQENKLAVIVDQFSKLSFRELVTLLGAKEHIEEGYKVRDVSLACLVKFHHFHLGRALSEEVQNRPFLFTKQGKDPEKILFFPGLTDYQFDAIVHYAYTEKWPLTIRGLYSLLKKWEGPVDKSLMSAFYHTKEFEWLEMVFKRGGVKVKQKDLLQMVLQADLSLLSTFIKDHEDVGELTFREFLLSYIFHKSPASVQLLLETDFLFAVKKLDDPMILTLLSLIEEKTEDVEQFCFELIKSCRSDAVWEKSAQILYAIAGETISEPYNHKDTLQRFVLSQALKEKWSEEKKEMPIADSLFGPKVIHYLVKEGDTLWMIARKYKIDIDHLIKHNKLANDHIYPGIEIEIPEE
jgi:hypothetical protein